MKDTAQLYGLILAGGKSTRMGNDKGLISYHGKPQREYLFDLASDVCNKVFYSAREEQVESFSSDAPIIIDRNEYKGPFNGILSAHRTAPGAAWLILACDLPLLDARGIHQLIAERDPNKAATAFASADSGLPEPLIAIWEPEGLKNAMAHMETSQSSCPRKFLINSNTKLVRPAREEILFNANSVEEYHMAKEKLL